MTFKFLQKKISLLDTTIYKDENNSIQAILYYKPIDQQAYLHGQSEHSKSLRNSILYSQARRLKAICSTATEYDKNYAISKYEFLERQCKEEVLNEQIKNSGRIERKELFTNKEKRNKTELPLLITYYRTLPNISGIVNRN